MAHGKRRTSTGLGRATLIVCLVVLAACRSVEPTVIPSTDSSVRSTAPQSAHPSATSQPADLSAIEWGFSAFPRSSRDPAGFATYGLIIANPNPDRSAELFGFRVRLFDSGGLVVGDEHLVIWTVLPLAHVAIGNDVLGAGGAASMTVEVEPNPSSWWRIAPPAGTDAVSFREVVTVAGPDGIRTTGLIDSTLVGPTSLQVVALYRDRQGAIAGAAFGDVFLGSGQGIEFQTSSLAEFTEIPATEMFWFPLN